MASGQWSGPPEPSCVIVCASERTAMDRLTSGPPPLTWRPTSTNWWFGDHRQLTSVVTFTTNVQFCIGTFRHLPDVGSHESVVHESPSSQLTGTFRQPAVGSHESVVQRLLSLQSMVTWL